MMSLSRCLIDSTRLPGYSVGFMLGWSRILGIHSFFLFLSSAGEGLSSCSLVFAEVIGCSSEKFI